jgi:c-di-GMP-binding flagellar brake protein YcgR
MPPILQPQFLPETDRQLLARYAVDGPLAVRAILEDIGRGRALIALYSPRSDEDFVVSQLLGFDEARVRFDFTTDQARRQALLGAGSVVVVAFLDRIKIQFEGHRLQFEERPDGAVLSCGVPARVHRIQRRDAFRVRPPSEQPAECVIRRFAGEERQFRVLDLSAGGVALLAPPDLPQPQPGEVWQHCRLEIPGYAPIPCDLEVRVVSPGLRGEADGCRLGCGFHRPTPETQRAVQIYVMDVERGRTPRIGG